MFSDSSKVSTVIYRDILLTDSLSDNPAIKLSPNQQHSSCCLRVKVYYFMREFESQWPPYALSLVDRAILGRISRRGLVGKSVALEVCFALTKAKPLLCLLFVDKMQAFSYCPVPCLLTCCDPSHLNGLGVNHQNCMQALNSMLSFLSCLGYDAFLAM